MGLDMYLTGRKYFWQNWSSVEGAAVNREEDGRRVKSMDVELGYWRKHPNLHGYIVNTFAEGNDDCKEIELGADDLRKLIKAVKAKELPHTTGFFFGASDNSQSERDADVKILTGALDWLLQSDKAPFDAEPDIKGPGFAVTVVKPLPSESKVQRVTRSVHYEGSW